MEEKKLQILTVIISGMIKTRQRYNEYIELLNNKELSSKYQAELKNKKEFFLVSLYNYVRAFIDKQNFFEDYDKIKKILDTTIKVKSWKNFNQGYTFGDVYNIYRNRNVHFDKYNCEEQYMIFHTIDFDMFENLFVVCNIVLDVEVKKLTENDIVKIVFGNSDLKFGLINFIDIVSAKNEKEKDKFPYLYEKNKKILETLKKVDYNNITIEKVEDVYLMFKEYLLDEEMKKEFIVFYDEQTYNELINLYLDEDAEFEESRKKFDDLLYGKLIKNKIDDRNF